MSASSTLSTKPISPTDHTALPIVHTVLSQLRPALSLDSFLEQYPEMYANGYHLHAGFDGEEVIVVAGMQLFHSFSSGRFLWVYDLVTSEAHRSKGFGLTMLDYIHEVARSKGCTQVRLDSRLVREKAHAFYEHKADYEKYGYVFLKRL